MLDSYDTGVRFLQRAYERNPGALAESSAMCSVWIAPVAQTPLCGRARHTGDAALLAVLTQMGKADHLASDPDADGNVDGDDDGSRRAHDPDADF